MKVLSLFSGIGAFEKALTNLGVDYELAAYCEIDKYASRSYAAIHGVSESLNLGDITKVDEKALPHDLDLITYGFPCQDISIAGRQKGLIDEDGKQTRSGLFFEALRIIEETQPRVAIAENVKNLTSKTFKSQFELVLKSLEDAGYNNYWKVLNLKDFGIPQNRERVFIVSIRKDIVDGTFRFPDGFPLEKRLKDVLEDEVDKKYFVSDKGFKFITNPMRIQKKYTAIDGDIALCLTAKGQSNWTGTFVSDEANAPTVRQIGNCCPTRTRDNPNQGRIYDAEGIAPALNCMGGGNRQPCVMTEPAVLCPKRTEYGKAIRKLTPKECFRLMGFSDTDHEKAAAVNSNTQLYKQAGNSIGVPVVQYIIQALIDCGALAVNGADDGDEDE